MTTLEITIVGLCAILTEDPGCGVGIFGNPFGPSSDQPFNLVFVSPGGPHPHFPLLWIKTNDLEPGTISEPCWTKDRRNHVSCTDDFAVWAHFDLTDRELEVVQLPGAQTGEAEGNRPLSGGYETGTSLGDPTSCRHVDVALQTAEGKSFEVRENEVTLGGGSLTVAERNALTDTNRRLGLEIENHEKSADDARELCAADVSWLPSYSKTIGRGEYKLRCDLFDSPYPTVVRGFVRDLRGTLSAAGDGRTVWKWEWNYGTCSGDASYEQDFAPRGLISNIQIESKTLELSKIRGTPDTRLIILRDGDADGKIDIEIWNVPRSGDDDAVPLWNDEMSKLKWEDNKCKIPHFKAFAQLMQDPPECQRYPYVEADAGGDCPDVSVGSSLGPDDPFCPGVVFP